MREIPSKRKEGLQKPSSHLTVVCKQRDPGSHVNIKYLKNNLKADTPGGGGTPLSDLHRDIVAR